MSQTKSITHYIHKIASGDDLSRSDAVVLFNYIMDGKAEDSEIGAILMGLKRNGETVDLLTGAAEVLRQKVLKVPAPEMAIDTCGTGGDAKGTYNISTASAIITAACGVPVAKHGNRSVSSKSGSADVLECLGLRLDLSPETVGQSIEQFNLGFMFAPAHHSAMRHVGKVRKQLGFRSIFNLLGPLANPAGTKRQILGVYSKDWVEPLAHVAKQLGGQHVWVVHGLDGLDEITTTDKTYVAELKDGTVNSFTLTPGDFGYEKANMDDLIGGNAKENAKEIENLLDGKPSPYRDICCVNTAAALLVGGKIDRLKDGIQMAEEALDSHKARDNFNAMISFCRGDG